MKNTLRTILAAVVMLALPALAAAQDEVEATVKADVVSRYMWRGQDKGGFSVQPRGRVSWKGLSFTAWGSTGLDKDDDQEIDLSIGFRKYGFNLGVTDYWQTGADAEDRYFCFSQTDGAHLLEANIGYACRWASLQAYTVFYGNDYTPDGDRAYTSYIELAVPFQLGGVDFQARAGLTPFKSRGTRHWYLVQGLTGNYLLPVDTYAYSKQTSCILASLRATKTIRLTDNVSMPIFAELHANPYMQRANLVFGVSLCPF